MENDSRSIYHLIALKDYDLKQAINFLQDKSPLYKNIDYKLLSAISLTTDDLTATLLQLEWYMSFRKDYPLSRYLDHILSPFFSISTIFFDASSLLFGVAFNKAISTFGLTNNELDLPRELLRNMLMFVPKLIQFYVTKKDYDGDEKIQIFSNSLLGFIDMTFREIGAQCGYISSGLSIRYIDPEEYITDEYHDKLGEAIYNALSKQLDFHE